MLLRYTDFLKVLVIKSEVGSSYGVEECRLLSFSTNRLISPCMLSYYEEHINSGGTQGSYLVLAPDLGVWELVAGSAHSLLV